MTRQNISYVLDLDGFLLRTGDMKHTLETRVHTAFPGDVSFLKHYKTWSALPIETRGSFLWQLPAFIAQKEQKDIAPTLRDIFSEVCSMNWADPEAHAMLSLLPKDKVFVVTRGEEEFQRKKLRHSGLLDTVIDPTHVFVVPRKDVYYYALACHKMGIELGSPTVHGNDRVDELKTAGVVFPHGLPVVKGDRYAGTQWRMGKEREGGGIVYPPEPYLPSLIRIHSLRELPGVLHEKGYL